MLPEQIQEVLREKRKITVAEYLQLPETNIHTELIDGLLYVYEANKGNMPPLQDTHQKALVRVLAFLSEHLPANQLHSIPTDVHLNINTVLQPDIFWVNPQNTQCVLMDDGYWHGAPDFVIEIVTKGLVAIDYITKFKLYQHYGVLEYWIVDPVEHLVEIYVHYNGMLQRQSAYTVGQTFTSQILNGISVTVAELFG